MSIFILKLDDYCVPVVIGVHNDTNASICMKF